MRGVTGKRDRQAHNGFPKSAILTLLTLMSAISSGQDTEAGQVPLFSTAAQGNSARFLVHSDLVLVPVTVTTGNGRVVQGLSEQQLSVFEDSVQQVITHFTSESAPASVGLVFDSRNSMKPRLAKAQEAV
jgi:hypothetical protein